MCYGVYMSGFKYKACWNKEVNMFAVKCKVLKLVGTKKLTGLQSSSFEKSSLLEQMQHVYLTPPPPLIV